MALIICPFCGKQVSDKAANCPHCNNAISETKNNRNLLKCEECGATLGEGVKICPNCGCPVTTTFEDSIESTKSKEPEQLDERKQVVNEDENVSTSESEEKKKSNDDLQLKKEDSDSSLISQNNNIETKLPEKKKARIIVGVIIAAVIVAVAAFFGTAKKRAYSQAVRDFDAAEYSKAYDEFTALADYNDAAERATACVYQLAEGDFKAEKYQEAHDQYITIEDYEDSAEKAKECIYVLAGKDYDSEAFEDSLEKYKSISDYKDAAEKISDCEYQLSVDGKFMRELSKGLMERWDQNDQDEEDGSMAEDETKCEANYCDIELEHLESFENETFDNEDLSTDAKKYIQLLRDAKEATTYVSVDVNKYYTDWNNVYNKRTQQLKKFVSDYNLTVDEDHQDTLNELMRDAGAAAKLDAAKDEINKMTKSFTVSITKDEYGVKQYSMHMKNTTQYTFEYFYVDISLLNEDGNIVETGNVSQVTNWAPGQTADVDAWISNDVDPANYTLSFAPHYSTADGTIYD